MPVDAVPESNAGGVDPAMMDTVDNLVKDEGSQDPGTSFQAFSFDGNQSRVINTRELDDIVTQMGSANDDKVFSIKIHQVQRTTGLYDSICAATWKASLCMDGK